MKLLLTSNFTNFEEKYLGYRIEEIRLFSDRYKNIVFTPYAAVSFIFDENENKVKEKFNKVGLEINSVDRRENAQKTVEQSDATVTGGGNNFVLLKNLYDKNLIEVIRKKLEAGTLYFAWSTSENVACGTIKTTNDMPILELKSIEALWEVNFQINRHYTDTNLQGNAGETRQEPMEELLEVSKNTVLVA